MSKPKFKFAIGDKVRIKGATRDVLGLITQLDKSGASEPYFVTYFDTDEGNWWNEQSLKRGWPKPKKGKKK